MSAVDLFGRALTTRNDVLLGAAIRGLSDRQLERVIVGLEMSADVADTTGNPECRSIASVLVAAARRWRDNGDDPVRTMRELAAHIPGFYDEQQEAMEDA